MQELFKLQNGLHWYFEGHIPKEDARNKVIDFLKSINDKRGKDDIAEAEHIWIRLEPSKEVPGGMVLVYSHKPEEGMVPATVVEDMRCVQQREEELREAAMNGSIK